MKALLWFVLGAGSVLAAGVVAAVVMVGQAHGFSAREAPGGMERWLAQRAREAAVPVEVRNLANPAPDTPEVLAEARAHWADHCATCHANDGSGDISMGKRMYPPAPDMRAPGTQHLSDGELFYIIQNGVRLTGMPAWGGASGHDEEDSWKLVRFIRHLPAMTAEERREIEKLNPKGPEEWKEAEEEEKFLKGETTNVQEHHHH